MSYDYGVQLSLEQILGRFRNGDTPGEGDFEQLIRLAEIGRRLINEYNSRTLKGLEVNDAGSLELKLDETSQGESGLSVSAQGLKLAGSGQQKLAALKLDTEQQKISLDSMEAIEIPLADSDSDGLMSSQDWSTLDNLSSNTGSDTIRLGQLTLDETTDNDGNTVSVSIAAGEVTLTQVIQTLLLRAKQNRQPFSRSDFGLAD
ncbi:hypothetical protein ACWJJH_02840 [Endozoicomonadaceae bacterium StTr2]